MTMARELNTEERARVEQAERAMDERARSGVEGLVVNGPNPAARLRAMAARCESQAHAFRALANMVELGTRGNIAEAVAIDALLKDMQRGQS